MKMGVDDFLKKQGKDAFVSLKRLPLTHGAFKKAAQWFKAWKRSRSAELAAPGDQLQGRELVDPDPSPWTTKVNGRELLNKIREQFERYVALPRGAAVAFTLWVVFTYAIDVFEIAPILAVLSAVRRSGKTTTLDILAALCRRPIAASNITPAALFRSVEKAQPTLLLDEAETYVRMSEELRGILNAGHGKGSAFVIRTVGKEFEPRRFSVFCPKAVAAIEALPGTIMDRSVTIWLKRRAPSEKVEPLRHEGLKADLEPLRRQCLRWVQDNSHILRKADPEVPPLGNDRAVGNWRPLLAIADLAGGPWPQWARSAALRLTKSAGEDTDAVILLLEDLRTIFTKTKALPTHIILQKLVQLEERPWGDYAHGRALTARGLGRLLGSLEIKSQQMTLGLSNVRGYTLKSLQSAFARYLPPAKPLEALDPEPEDDSE